MATKKATASPELVEATENLANSLLALIKVTLKEGGNGLIHDEDEDEAPKKGAGKKKVVEDEDDDDEPAPKKGAAKASAAPSKGGKKKVEDEDDDDEPTKIDLKAIRSLIKEKAASSGSAKIAAILDKFGVESATDLEKDDYEDFYNRLSKLK